MKITQALVDRIIARAKLSEMGLGRGLVHKNSHLKLDMYEQHNLSTLAMLLVEGYDEKYDLISVFQAALEIVHSETLLYAASLVAPDGNPSVAIEKIKSHATLPA